MAPTPSSTSRTYKNFFIPSSVSCMAQTLKKTIVIAGTSRTLESVHVLKGIRAEGATRNDWFLSASLAATGIVLLHLPFLAILLLVVKAVDMRSVIVAAILGAATFLAIVFRRHYPEIFCFIVLTMIALHLVMLTYPTTSWLVIFLAVFEVARRSSSTRARIALALALVVSGLGPFTWVRGSLFASQDLHTVAILIGVSMAGAVTTAYSIGRRGYDVSAARSSQLRAEREAAELQIAQQEAHQHTLETQIRTNIARELHDVVAHSIAVMVVQAEGGLAQATRSNRTAEKVLTTISETGREALYEMRRIVRTLRSDKDGRTEISSAPSLSGITTLAEKANATLTVSGSPHGSTPTIEMTIYRVIQEALTNSLKHAGPDADPHVTLAWLANHVSVTVTNKVSDGNTPDEPGSGLLGMAERVQAVDGTLTVGPTETGGFRVCARIPLTTHR